MRIIVSWGSILRATYFGKLPYMYIHTPCSDVNQSPTMLVAWSPRLLLSQVVPLSATQANHSHEPQVHSWGLGFRDI